MATLMEMFQGNVIGSDSSISDYKSSISSKGDFSRIKDIQVILNSWNNILLTPLRSYDHDPEYGSEIYKFVFEPATQDTISKITNELQYRLMLFDNRAQIKNITVKFIKNQKAFVLDIDVYYEGEEATLSTTVNGDNYLNITQ